MSALRVPCQTSADGRGDDDGLIHRRCYFGMAADNLDANFFCSRSACAIIIEMSSSVVPLEASPSK